MEFMDLRGIRPPQAVTVGDVGSYGILNGAYGPYRAGEGSFWPNSGSPGLQAIPLGFGNAHTGRGPPCLSWKHIPAAQTDMDTLGQDRGRSPRV